MEMSIAMTPTTKELYFVILEKEYECDETSYDVIIGLFISCGIFQFWINSGILELGIIFITSL